jgi:hypothetical protein
VQNKEVTYRYCIALTPKTASIHVRLRRSISSASPFQLHLVFCRASTRGSFGVCRYQGLSAWVSYSTVLHRKKVAHIRTCATRELTRGNLEIFHATLTRFMINSMSTPTTNLVISAPATSTELWPEPLDTPGIIPRHLKRAATASFPVLEVLQRILYRFRPPGTSGVGDLEKILAVIGLYQAARPVYNHLKDFFLWACTVQITVPEMDPVATEILAWIGAEIILKDRTRSAMMVTSGTEHLNSSFHHPIRFPGPGGGGGDPADETVVCLPPLGTRIFW